MGERAEDTPDDEDRGRGAEAALAEPHLPGVGAGEVEDVLGEREADAHEAGVDQTVEDAVDHVPAQPQQQQDEGALGGLLGDRCHHDRGPDHPAPGDRCRSTTCSSQCGGGGHQRAPAERHQASEPAGLGLVAVQPQVAERPADRPAAARAGSRPRRSGWPCRDEDVAAPVPPRARPPMSTAKRPRRCHGGSRRGRTPCLRVGAGAGWPRGQARSADGEPAAAVRRRPGHARSLSSTTSPNRESGLVVGSAVQ